MSIDGHSQQNTRNESPRVVRAQHIVLLALELVATHRDTAALRYYMREETRACELLLSGIHTHWEYAERLTITT